MTEKLKKKIEGCKTGNQVMALLQKNHIQIVRNDTAEVGTFSVWLDDVTRIYKPIRQPMRVQTWQKITANYSGIPTYRPSLRAGNRKGKELEW